MTMWDEMAKAFHLDKLNVSPLRPREEKWIEFPGGCMKSLELFDLFEAELTKKLHEINDSSANTTSEFLAVMAVRDAVDKVRQVLREGEAA